MADIRTPEEMARLLADIFAREPGPDARARAEDELKRWRDAELQRLRELEGW